MNLRLEFNADIIKRVKGFDITSDYIGSTLFILFALLEKRYDLLDEFDDSNKARRAIIMYRMLERKLLLKKAKESEVHYELTAKAQELVSYIKEQFKEQHIDISAASLEPMAEKESPIEEKKEEDDASTWITEYIKIFPPGEYHGKLLRASTANVLPRMNEFVKKFNRSKDTILGATRMYIKAQRDSGEGYQFTQNAMYFIWKADKNGKDKTYNLETWCERFEEAQLKGQTEIDTSHWDTV